MLWHPGPAIRSGKLHPVDPELENVHQVDGWWSAVLLKVGSGVHHIKPRLSAVLLKVGSGVHHIKPRLSAVLLKVGSGVHHIKPLLSAVLLKVGSDAHHIKPRLSAVLLKVDSGIHLIKPKSCRITQSDKHYTVQLCHNDQRGCKASESIICSEWFCVMFENSNKHIERT